MASRSHSRLQALPATTEERSGADDARTSEESATSSRAVRPTVATCVDHEHPTLLGRVRVQLDDSKRWVPVLRGLVVRTGDRVLLSHPDNHDEPIVTGILDGLAPRPDAPSREAVSITLHADERVRIADEAGNPLLDLHRDADGPRLVLLQHDLRIAVAGELRLEGERVTIRATAGEAHLEATDDVVIEGEHIHLN